MEKVIEKDKRECNVCGNGIRLKKEEIYVIKNNTNIMIPTLFNAIDCPFCGCQTILKRRYPMFKQESKEP